MSEADNEASKRERILSRTSEVITAKTRTGRRKMRDRIWVWADFRQNESQSACWVTSWR